MNKKGKGRYKTRGRKISFKSGAYAKSKVYGVWKKEVGPSGTNYEIRIFGKADKEERFVCETPSDLGRVAQRLGSSSSFPVVRRPAMSSCARRTSLIG